jgi:hypothetical protein
MSERERYWRGVLEQWRVGGLTRLGFCRLRDISYATLNQSHTEGVETGTQVVILWRLMSNSGRRNGV